MVRRMKKDIETSISIKEDVETSISMKEETMIEVELTTIQKSYIRKEY
jgi:hypothetical protein